MTPRNGSHWLAAESFLVVSEKKQDFQIGRLLRRTVKKHVFSRLSLCRLAYRCNPVSETLGPPPLVGAQGYQRFLLCKPVVVSQEQERTERAGCEVVSGAPTKKEK